MGWPSTCILCRSCKFRSPRRAGFSTTSSIVVSGDLCIASAKAWETIDTRHVRLLHPQCRCLKHALSLKHHPCRYVDFGTQTAVDVGTLSTREPISSEMRSILRTIPTIATVAPNFRLHSDHFRLRPSSICKERPSIGMRMIKT